MARRIAIATSTRADWGLLSPLASALREAGAELLIYATNMHLLPGMGETWREIESDGFDIAARIPVSGDKTEIAAGTVSGFGRIFRHDRPDAVVLLGDRFEMLAVATAACLCGVPVVHIAGGTVSEGAMDDSLRHAITKLSTLHLPETPLCAERIISMGENPENVIVSGALGVYNAFNITPLTLPELEASLGFNPGKDFLIATLHAATLSPLAPETQMDEFLKAIGEFPDLGFIITYPNNDTDPAPLISRIETFAATHRNVHAVPSLGRVRYMSALRYARGVIGNSSSGIVEVPSAGIPVLDTGIRQKGREAGPGVLHCGSEASEIAAGIRRILSPEAAAVTAGRENPYFREDTPGIMCREIMSYPFTPFPSKRFYHKP